MSDSYDETDGMIEAQMEDAAMMDAKDEPGPTLLPAQYKPEEKQQTLQATGDPRINRAMEVAAALDQAYPGASKAKINPEEAILLRKAFPDEDVEIRPHDGLLYIPHILISERLNDAIGMGEWAMVRRREWMDNNLVYAEWVMLIRGAFIGETVTSHKYIPNNPQMDYADSLESTRGVAIRRIAAKDLTCGSQVWHPAYCRDWQAKFAYYDGKLKKWVKRPLQTPANPSATTNQPPTKSPPEGKIGAKSKAPAETDDQRLERWKAQLRPLEPYASFWLIDNGKLLPTEDIDSLHVTSVPGTVNEANEIVASIKKRMQWGKERTQWVHIPDNPPAKTDPEPESSPTDNQDEDGDDGDSIMLRVIGKPVVHWRKVEVPFGKNKGEKFGDIEKGSLWWWCTKWEPKEWAGKDGKLRSPSDFDLALRVMLDQLKEKYEFKDNKEKDE